MTTEELDGAALAVKMTTDHNNHMKALEDKYFGAAQMAHGRSLPDLFSRKRFLMYRIRDCGVWAGHAQMRGRKCKSYESPLYQKYNDIEIELNLLSEHLMLEVMMMEHK